MPYQFFVTLRRVIYELLCSQRAEKVVIHHPRHCQRRIFRIQLFSELFFTYPLFNYIDQNMQRVFYGRLDNNTEKAGRICKLTRIVAQKKGEVAITLN